MNTIGVALGMEAASATSDSVLLLLLWFLGGIVGFLLVLKNMEGSEVNDGRMALGCDALRSSAFRSETRGYSAVLHRSHAVTLLVARLNVYDLNLSGQLDLFDA